MQINDINVQCKRIGAKDQGNENRPRFIQLEFGTTIERNSTNKESDKS